MISSLEELLDELPECSGSDYVRIAKNMVLPASDFNDIQSWSQEGYTRNCIERTESYELILLCWEPDQYTPIHCHGGEECWVYVLQGDVEECYYEEHPKSGLPVPKGFPNIRRQGQLSYMNDEMGFHTLKNITSGRAMSLHLYMNPIDRCRIYDTEEGDLKWKEMTYDSELVWG